MPEGYSFNIACHFSSFLFRAGRHVLLFPPVLSGHVFECVSKPYPALLQNFTSLSPNPPFFSVRYQVHSCNSLSEWPNLVRKGARSFKIDPRWLDFDGGVRCNDSTGCLILSHDPPLPRLDYAMPGYYSHLDDVLGVLTHVEPVKSVARREGLRIALCFKGAPRDVCGGSDNFSVARSYTGHSARWLRKVDAFVEAAKNMLVAQELEDMIEFVLDGGGVPVDCLAQRWRPWRSVYMNGTAPAKAFVSDLVRDGLDRFQVLNEPADLELWKGLADPKVNYGKFSDGAYPYQLWEPGSQAGIQALMEVFRGGQPHAPGLDFASNSDAAMFQVYAGLGLNQPLRQDGEIKEEVEKPEEEDMGGLVTIIRPGLALILLDRRGAEYRIYAFDPMQPLSSSSGQDLRELEISSATRLVLPGMEGRKERGKGRRIQSLTVLEDKLLVSTSMGNYFLYDIESDNGVSDGNICPLLTLCLTGSFKSIKSPFIPMAAVSMPKGRVRRRTPETPKIETVRFSFSSTILLLDQKLSKSNATLTLLELYIDNFWQQKYCLLAYQVRRRQTDHDFQDDVVTSDGCLWWRADNVLGKKEEATPGWEVQSAVAVLDVGEGVVLIFASAAGKLYMTEHSLVKFSAGSAEEENCVVEMGVGNSVAASAATMARIRGNRGKETSTVVMLVSSDGFCYNSHLHNTGPFNVCELIPHATPGVLDFTYASVTKWVHFLRGTCARNASITSSSTSWSRRRLVNVCDADLLHGSYDLGYHPSIVLFPTSISGSDGGVGMLEVHRGFTEDCPEESLTRLGKNKDDENEKDVVSGSHLRSLKACECGAALVRPKGSLVADSFPLQLRFV